MKRVIIETPYAGDIERNIKYLKACILDSLKKGEAPFASHLFYTQVLNDDIPKERELGIKAGLSWGDIADATIVYTDHGISNGMKLGIENAKINKRLIEYRKLYA